MKFLKNRKVAVVIMIAAILIVSVAGICRAPTKLPAVKTGQWVYDGANVFSAQEEQYLTQGNAALLSDHGAVVAVATMDKVKNWDLMDFCMDLAEEWDLSGSDFILVMDIQGDNYWLIQGADIMYDFTDEMAGAYVRQFLENDFAARQYGAGAVKLFDALRAWYDGAGVGGTVVPDIGYNDEYVDQPGGGGGSGFGGMLLFVIIVVVLIVALDGARFTRYRRYTPGVIYRPFIFGRPRRPRTPPPPRAPGGFRPPTGGARPSGGFRPSGTTRPSGGSRVGTSRPSGARRSSGSFGGGRSSGGFKGGRTGSFGGGRSSGGFGGGRR